MGYGVGVLLLAIGLILALAVQDTLAGVDLVMVGWILTAVGVLAIVLAAASTVRSRSTVTYADGSRVDQQRQVPPA